MEESLEGPRGRGSKVAALGLLGGGKPKAPSGFEVLAQDYSDFRSRIERWSDGVQNLIVLMAIRVTIL